MKKLLLADADSINSDVLKTALEGEGYQVVRVNSPDEWNKVAHRRSFHMIIMDESFLGLSKHLFSLSKEAFRALEHTPIIVMTEYPEIVERGYRFPKKAKFLMKPFQAEEMFGAVRQIFFDETVAVA